MTPQLKSRIKDLIQELDNLMEESPSMAVAQACNKLTELLETEG
jgi:hypothetical protein